MEIKSGMYFRGDINGKTIMIINASDELITFSDVDNGKIFIRNMEKIYRGCGEIQAD